jgi:hypothetical protein
LVKKPTDFPRPRNYGLEQTFPHFAHRTIHRFWGQFFHSLAQQANRRLLHKVFLHKSTGKIVSWGKPSAQWKTLVQRPWLCRWRGFQGIGRLLRNTLNAAWLKGPSNCSHAYPQHYPQLLGAICGFSRACHNASRHTAPSRCFNVEINAKTAPVQKTYRMAQGP